MMKKKKKQKETTSGEMDPVTCGTSITKHNIYCVFSSWKISRDLEKLTLAQAQLRSKVDMIAGKKIKDMHQTKVTWLVEAKNLLLHVEILKAEMNDAKQFFIWKQPCGLSDKFAKMTMAIRRKLEDAIKLEAESVVGAIGHIVVQIDDMESSLSSSLSLQMEHYILLKSARQAAFEIMEAFQDSNVKLIGLVGMRGVGKTTLAILMGMKARESGMFDAVIKVLGSFKPDPGVIRSNIAKALDSEWNAREVGEDNNKARELIGGIMKKVEKILIILDDVWEFIDLKDIGIPFGEDHKGCKILLTTCLQHVCQEFGCQEIVHLRAIDEKLDSEGALWPNVKTGSLPTRVWLWGEHMDNYLNDEKMQSFFMLCSHFPKKYAPTVEELTRYGIGQRLFKDYISIESARKAAHSMVSSLRSSLIVEEKGDRVNMCHPYRIFALYKQNRARYSQLSTSDRLSEDELIKLFASTETIYLQMSKFPGYKFFNLKSLSPQTLTIIEDDDGANFYKDRRFGYGFHMVKVKVLCLQSGCFPSRDWAKNPPLSLEGIENLKGLLTLQIKGYKVKGVSSLVELNNLEILGFLGCTFEDMLPEGLRELHNLKMLDYSYCVELHEQPQEWILKLPKLEELYITDFSLEVWSRSGFLQCLQKHNSGLSLTVLSPKVNSKFFSQQFVVPKFESYRIELNLSEEEEEEEEEGEEEEKKEEEEDKFVHFKPIPSSKALRIKALPISPFVELFKGVEYLHLSDTKDCHNIVPSLDKGGLNSLQDLQLHYCEDLEYLIVEEVIGGDLVQVCAFSKLTNLELVGLAKLKSLWTGTGHMIDLGNLKNFQLRDCDNLRGYIFSKLIGQNLKQLETLEVSGCTNLEAMLELSSDDGLVRLPQLKELQVCNCWKLKHVFISSNNEVDEENNERDHCCYLELPQLRLLVLKTLFALETFSQGKDFIVAPLLEELRVHYCPELELFTLTSNNGMLPRLKKLHLGDVGSDVSETELDKAYTKMSKESTSRQHFTIIGRRLFDSFGTCFLSNLKELILNNANMRVLWKDSTINGLQNLTHLLIDYCSNLEYVFTPLSVHNVPNLKSLRIEMCDKLGQIVAEDETMTEAHGQQHPPMWFPNLTDIYISFCPKLSNVFPARVVDQLPKLKRLHLDWGMTSLTQIFGSDRDSKGIRKSKVVQLPLLQNLILKDPSNMARFAPEGFHFTFPALDHLEVRNCAKMQTRFYETGDRGVYAIIESGEIRQSAADYTEPMNAAVGVPIFSGDNYGPWRNKMMTYFKSQDLWEVVAQGIKDDVPPEETSNEKKKDAQALFVIQNSMLYPIYSKIIGATSARDAWLTLEKIYLNAIDPYILKLFSGNEQEAERWSKAKRLEMDADNNILWPDGRTAGEHEKPVIVDLTDPNGLHALDLI